MPPYTAQGYHDYSNGVPYIFIQLAQNSPLDVADPLQIFADLLSHEMAETTVDPKGDYENPEVCDICGGNCSNPYVAYFDKNITYLGTFHTTAVVDFNYAFYIAAVGSPEFVFGNPSHVSRQVTYRRGGQPALMDFQDRAILNCHNITNAKTPNNTI